MAVKDRSAMTDLERTEEQIAATEQDLANARRERDALLQGIDLMALTDNQREEVDACASEVTDLEKRLNLLKLQRESRIARDSVEAVAQRIDSAKTGYARISEYSGAQAAAARAVLAAVQQLGAALRQFDEAGVARQQEVQQIVRAVARNDQHRANLGSLVGGADGDGAAAAGALVHALAAAGLGVEGVHLAPWLHISPPSGRAPDLVDVVERHAAKLDTDISALIARAERGQLK